MLGKSKGRARHCISFYQMEHQFQNIKPFLKTEARWRHRTKLLFWKALVLSVLMKNGLHYLSVGNFRNLVMSMEQLCCKTKCMYLVEIIMGVILVTFSPSEIERTWLNL